MSKIKGRQVETFTVTENGVVPAPGSASGKVLSDNGTWIPPSGGSPYIITELDFGSEPVSSKLFNISSPGLTPADIVEVSTHHATATGRVGNDWEFDMPFFSVKERVDEFHLNVVFQHLIVGKRTIKYKIN